MKMGYYFKKTAAMACVLTGTLISISSCDNNAVYDEHKDLSAELQWNKDLKIEFNPYIKDTVNPYTIEFAFRHASGFAHKTLNLLITFISPSGLEQKKKYDIEVMNESGDFLGEGIGDIWDLEVEIEKGFKFDEAGQYSLIVEYDMPYDPLHLAVDIGIEIEKE